MSGLRACRSPEGSGEGPTWNREPWPQGLRKGGVLPQSRDSAKCPVALVHQDGLMWGGVGVLSPASCGNGQAEVGHLATLVGGCSWGALGARRNGLPMQSG